MASETLTIEHVRIPLDQEEDEDGILVFRERTLAAILVCLDAAFYEGDRGRWHVEAGFGRCATPSPTFATLEIALRWISSRLGMDADEAIAPALAGFERRDRSS